MARPQIFSIPERLDASPKFAGKGVCMGFVDSGFYPHPDLMQPARRVRAYADAARDTPVGSDNTTPLRELVPDPASVHGQGLAAILRERADLAGVLQDLTDTEREVVTLRFGLRGDEPMTLEAIGRRMGVTRERVRQIEAGALRRLRTLLAARDVRPSDLL